MATTATPVPNDERTPLLGVSQPNGNHVQERRQHLDPNSPYLIPISTTRFWLIFGPVCLQFFVAMFDSYFMSSSHPVITSYFHASNSASWLSTSFMLTSTAFQPMFGRVSDTIGRRPVYLVSLSVFCLTTLWCALADSIESFIAARAMCGLAAGGMMSMALIMTNDLVKIEVRGTYQAYINLLYGSGAAFGAAFGGALCDSIGWRWTFGIQIPPIIFIIVIAYLFVPTDLGPQLARRSNQPWWEIVREFDIAGSFLLASSVAFLILGLNLGGNVLPWQHPFVIFSLVFSVFCGSVLLWVESRAKRPVMPLAMVSKSPRANLVFSNFFSMIGINHVLFNAPLYFQAVHGDSPTVAGFRLAVPAFLTTFFGVSTGLWLTWTGRMKAPQVAGGISMLLGGVLLSIMWPDIPMWLATIFVTPTSVGQGLMFPATTLSVLATTPVEDQAAMSSTLMLWRNLGTVMGVAISSVVLQNALLANLEKYITGPHKQEVSRSS
jgi:MFS family permease